MIFRCGFRAVLIYLFGVYLCDFHHLVIKFVRRKNARDNKTLVYRALSTFKCLFSLLDLIFQIEIKVHFALRDKNCSRYSQSTTWNLFLTMMRLVNYSIHSISTKLFLVTMKIILCWLTDWFQSDAISFCRSITYITVSPRNKRFESFSPNDSNWIACEGIINWIWKYGMTYCRSIQYTLYN